MRPFSELLRSRFIFKAHSSNDDVDDDADDDDDDDEHDDDGDDDDYDDEQEDTAHHRYFTRPPLHHLSCFFLEPGDLFYDHQVLIRSVQVFFLSLGDSVEIKKV